MDSAREPDQPLARIGPWTRLAGREIYENPWIRVREDQVLHPDGSRGIYGTIHYKHTAVGVVAIDSQGRVILVGQHRYPFDLYFWELPEGGCPIAGEGAELPAVSAARELREETGFTASRWDYLGPFVLSNSTSNEAGHLYLARDLSPGPVQPDPSERIEVKAVDFHEAFRMAMEGEITESITIMGLARARHFLDREESGKP